MPRLVVMAKMEAERIYGFKLDQGISYGTRREDIQVDLSADVAALAEGEELSEKFLEKAATIFEAAVKTKIASIVEELEAQKNTKNC